MVRRHPLPSLAGALLIWAVAPALLLAQDAMTTAEGRLVERIDITVEGQPNPDEQLQALVSVQIREPLRREDVRATIVQLGRVPGIESVEALATMTPTGVAVTFDLIPRHPIDRVEFTGTTGLSAAALGQELRRYYGGVPTSEPLDRIEETVERILSDQGYREAEVQASTVRMHDPDRATLVLSVDAGELSRVTSVSVSGTSPLTEREIVSRSGLRAGDPYRVRDLQSRLASLEDLLRERGYYEARVTHRAEPAASGGLDVILEVDAGPRVDIEYTGDPLPSGDIEAYVPIARAGAADEDLVEDSRRRLERALQAEGFRDALVATNRSLQSDGRVLVITFDIARGRRYRVGRVAVDPNLSLPADVINAALDLTPGEPYSDDAVGRGVARLKVEYQQRGFYQAEAAPDIESVGGDAAG